MNIFLLEDWSDQSHHPRKGQSHRVEDTVYEDGDIAYYEILHNGSVYAIYPYECSVEGVLP